jgi:hypothetical protein
VSRLLWAGVGAVGGIYLYRKGQHTWDDAKERGVAGNAAALASTTSSLLNHARRGLTEAQAEKDAQLADERVIQLPVRDHQPGMTYEVRAVPAVTGQARPQKVSRLITSGRTAKSAFQRQRSSA